MRGHLARGHELVVDVCLTTSTVAGLLVEDPVQAALLASRRLPPRLVRGLVRMVGLGRPVAGARAVLAAWLGGRDDEARCALEATAGGRGRARPRPAAVLLGELAVQLGREDLADRLRPERPAVSVARGLWAAGDLSGAVALLERSGGSGSLLARWRDHLRLLAPGARLAAPTGPPRAGLGRPTDGAPAAMHVLTNSLPHTQSGYSVRSQAVLAAQQDHGVRVGAVTRVGYPVTVGRVTARHRDVVDGVGYVRLAPLRLARTPTARLQQQVDLMAPLARAFAPSVLHTTTDWTNALATEALARAEGLPWVYEVRGLLEETWVASQPPDARAAAASSERYHLLRAKETEVATRADHVVTLSRTLRDELLHRGIDAAAVTVVPNGVDPQLLLRTSDAVTARDQVGLPRPGFWVGTVSSIVDYEGLDTLVDAVALLRRQGVDARLCLVGDGVARRGLERRAADAGLGDHAVFTGRVPRRQAADLHRALDVFAVPRRDLRVCRYVSPLKPVEAMAAGRPVVASDLPVLAELVHEPGSGLLTPAGDVPALAATLHRLADDPDLRDELGAAGRRFAATRTWEAAGRTYRALYERLAS